MVVVYCKHLGRQGRYPALAVIDVQVNRYDTRLFCTYSRPLLEPPFHIMIQIATG